MSASRWVSCALLTALSACTLYEKPTFDGGVTRDGSVSIDASGDASTDSGTGCAAGRLDCDGDRSNGCETPESVVNCGRCGTECALPSATARCGNGQCVVGACVAGFGNCDGDASNGCETRTSESTAHCGGCGNACTAGTVCVAGTCVNDCPAGQTRCGDQCVQTSNNVDHCGRCGNVCPSLPNAVRGCTAGRCDSLRCASGYDNCDSNASNGCESLGTGTNCGDCGTVCSGGTPVCAFDRDMMTWSCVAQEACTAPNARCGAACVDTNSSTLHCGGCNMPCNFANAMGGSCVTRVCTVSTCNAGFGNCDGNGRNGCEAQLNTITDCGMCGRSCMGERVASATCVSGACRLTCSAGFADCDGNPANGCEVDLSSAMHCGACNRACGASANAVGGTCTDGACRLSCRPDFANCDGEPANGCETDLSTEDNCGFCGNNCALAPACTMGTRRCNRAIRMDPFVCRCEGDV
jgi:hypothetical protein